MNWEADLYRKIAEVPQLPSDLFDSIEKCIRRRTLLRRSLTTLAALILLMIGYFGVAGKTAAQKDQTLSEVAEEMEIIYNYLNSKDIEGEFNLYSVVDGY